VSLRLMEARRADTRNMRRGHRRRRVASGRRAHQARHDLVSRCWTCPTAALEHAKGPAGGCRARTDVDRRRRDRGLVAEADGHLARPGCVPLPDGRQRPGSVPSGILRNTLKPNGSAIIATFALDGPQTCSGLAVARYSSETLAAELGETFQ
jgi:hypothetical protein